MYEVQITDYHCVPASVKQILSNLLPDAGQIHQLDLGALIGTDESGTTIRKLIEFIDDIGLFISELTPNNALTHLSYDILVLVTYDDGPDSAHCSVASKCYVKGPYNEMFIVLDDPYYGKELEIPFTTFKLLNPKFYLIHR